MKIQFKPCSKPDRAQCINEVMEEFVKLHDQLTYEYAGDLEFVLDVWGTGFVVHSEECKKRHATDEKPEPKKRTQPQNKFNQQD